MAHTDIFVKLFHLIKSDIEYEKQTIFYKTSVLASKIAEMPVFLF